ncbi:ribonuclease III domain-containing protein [Succiniclasticum ruminis]|uniref:Ribonuclease-3 n=1 Tax=Succiniclasticum ruminis DSM 9236 TaxID=1123323 RepID=A0A1I2CL17_9FIRM|nr:ribonuclease III domain-containing protein [Succiniclasticum ruminis]SFE69037.1 ribonuclease-3 [Succiniclasticum ruminis DSM 9236]
MLENKLKGSNNVKHKPWPENCAWPEPLRDGAGMAWEEDFIPDSLDEIAQDLVDIKDYFDSLVEIGRLNDDYTLNEDYDEEEELDEDEADDWEEEAFTPEMGEEYWDKEEQCFDYDIWLDDLSDHLNLLKIDCVPVTENPVVTVREAIGYEFVNENLLRQAFTRRAFAVEYGLSGCNEELEFLGDTVLNTVVTRDMLQQLSSIQEEKTEAPFMVRFQEGDLTKIRSRFVSKEFLSARAAELGLDRLILYGTGEEATESSREDMMEALIGAVTIDCDWDWDIITGVVDKLICVQLEKPDEFLKASYYDIFNAWHQRNFGTMPEYEVHGYKDWYDCTLRYRVPANDKEIHQYQRVDVFRAQNRSKAREEAAWDAYRFVMNHGLWVNLKESGIMPELENSINQLQELYQKKYLAQAPVYEFEERDLDHWYCRCRCDGISGVGLAPGKTKAKKQAAFEVLKQLFAAAANSARKA